MKGRMRDTTKVHLQFCPPALLRWMPVRLWSSRRNSNEDSRGLNSVSVILWMGRRIVNNVACQRSGSNQQPYIDKYTDRNTPTYSPPLPFLRHTQLYLSVDAPSFESKRNFSQAVNFPDLYHSKSIPDRLVSPTSPFLP